MIVVAGLVLAVCAYAGATPRSPVCGPAGAHTLASSSSARVYSRSEAVFGCAAGGARSYRLGQLGPCNGANHVSPVVLAGTVAAFGSERCGVDTASSQVIVRRLSDGGTLSRSPAITAAYGAEAFQAVTAVVVKRDGAVAWIATIHGIGVSGSPVEVHERDPHRAALLLDKGDSIRTGSLRRHGSRVSWRDGRSLRHATLG